jgi:lipoprotein signal peptidase
MVILTKMGVVSPLIIDQMLVHLTQHIFPCHRSHSWISGGVHLLVKNPYVLAFGFIENGRSWLFLTKMGVVWPFIIDQRLVHLTHICFLAIDHILGFLVETISWSKIRRC